MPTTAAAARQPLINIPFSSHGLPSARDGNLIWQINSSRYTVRLNSGTWARSRMAELHTANLPGGRSMRVAVRHVPGLLVAVSLSLLAAPALAQFGHPLKGTWSGDWGASKDS